MSHVGNGEHDLDDLDRLNLSPDVLEDVKQARIEARSIIDRLEPLHIDGWPDLIFKLEDCLQKAKRVANIMSKRFSGLDTREKVSELRESLTAATEKKFEKLGRAKVASWQESHEIVLD